MNDEASTSALADVSATSNATSPSSTTKEFTPLELQLKKKSQILRDLLHGLDALVFAQIAALYYLDNSTPLFLLRLLVHRTIQLSLIAAPFLPPISPSLDAALNRSVQSKSHLVMLLGVCLLSILLHVFLSVPSAGESTRGYLHGGLLIDFVGQKAAGPLVSRVRLVLIDFLIGFVQICAVSAVREIRRCDVAANGRVLQETLEASLPNLVNVLRGTPRIGGTAVRREENDDGVEMQNLNGNGRQEDSSGSSEADESDDAEGNGVDVDDEDARRRLLGSIADGVEDAHPLAEFHAGQVVATTFHVLDTVRNCFFDWKIRRRETV